MQTAFPDVSSALTSIDMLGGAEQAAATRGKAMSKALELSEACHKAGVDSGLRHLDAQRQQFSIQSQLITMYAQRQIAASPLFKAMRGGQGS